MQRRACSIACGGGELAVEVDALGDPQARGEPFERRALGPVADDRVAQRRVARPEHRQRAQHVGVALARDEVRDRDERRRRRRVAAGARRAAGALGRGSVGAEVHDARLARAVGARELGDALAVGEHQPRRAEAARDRRARRAAPRAAV